jgi:hypothetical protein
MAGRSHAGWNAFRPDHGRPAQERKMRRPLLAANPGLAGRDHTISQSHGQSRATAVRFDVDFGYRVTIHCDDVPMVFQRRCINVKRRCFMNVKKGFVRR